MRNIITNEQLISVLLSGDEPLGLHHLAEMHSCSKKTITRRLKDISESYLASYDVQLVGDAQEGYALKGKDLGRLRHTVEQQAEFTLWRSQAERQLLILLELFCSRDYFAKLYSLASKFHVTEATVLHDIRILNQQYPALQINGTPGIGTELLGSDAELRKIALIACYHLFDPSNFLCLVSMGHSQALGKMSCASNCYFKFVEDKIVIEEIISEINDFESNYNVILSDLSFINLFLFLTLKGIQNNGKFGSGLNESSDLHFTIGLEQDTLKKIAPDSLKDPLWQSMSCKIRSIIEADLNIPWPEFWQLLQPKLALLKYRSQIPEKYWVKRPEYPKENQYKSEIIRQLDKLCLHQEICSWLELDVLLGELGRHLKNIDTRIAVALVCVTGTGTALIVQKMIERFCPKVRVAHVFSLREYLKSGIEGQIVVSTVQTKILPESTVYIDSILDKNDWSEIQENILEKGKTK